MTTGTTVIGIVNASGGRVKLIICGLFSSSIVLGYFSAKLLYTIWDSSKESKHSKFIKKFIKKFFRKFFKLWKKRFRNLRKKLLEFYKKFRLIEDLIEWIRNWHAEVLKRFLMFIKSLFLLPPSIKRFLQKWFKYPFKKWFGSSFHRKRNFRLLSKLVKICINTFLSFKSFKKLLFFFHNKVEWIVQFRQLLIQLLHFLQKLMKQGLITYYIRFLIRLCLFGFGIGFLLGLYYRKHKINERDIDYLWIFFATLVELLRLCSWEELQYLLDLWKNFCDWLDVETYKSYGFGRSALLNKFWLQPVPEINNQPLKLIFKQSAQRAEIPLSMLSTPSVDIQLNFMYSQPIEYTIETFQFYLEEIQILPR